MSIRRRMAILISGGLVAATAAWATAQTRALPVPNPIVLAGSDIGFRVEAYQGNIPVGKLVVKVDGQWVEARFSSTGQRLTMR